MSEFPEPCINGSSVHITCIVTKRLMKHLLQKTYWRRCIDCHQEKMYEKPTDYWD